MFMDADVGTLESQLPSPPAGLPDPSGPYLGDLCNYTSDTAVADSSTAPANDRLNAKDRSESMFMGEVLPIPQQQGGNQGQLCQIEVPVEVLPIPAEQGGNRGQLCQFEVLVEVLPVPVEVLPILQKQGGNRGQLRRIEVPVEALPNPVEQLRVAAREKREEKRQLPNTSETAEQGGFPNTTPAHTPRRLPIYGKYQWAKLPGQKAWRLHQWVKFVDREDWNLVPVQ